MKKVGEYVKRDLAADLVAGIIVGLIALPLAIAFAVASGARPEQGIYTAIIAGIVIGVLSGSRFQISGPTGAFIVILLGIVNEFGIDGLMVAGFMAGIILLLMGIFKFGRLIKYIPYPVTIGFTAGIGVIIFSGQIKDFFGLNFEERPHGFVETIQAIAQGAAHGFNVSSVIIGAVSLLAFVVWKKYNQKIPPAPIALIAGISASFFITTFTSLPMPEFVGEIPSGLPRPRIPDFSWEGIKLLVPSAFTIAMLGAIESLLSAVVADGMTGTKHDSNRELIAQGVGNIILPFFGAIPATGAIARTAANIKNGARTRVSSVVHGLVLLVILLAAAPLARHIPMAALAAILMTVAYYMSEIPHFIHLLKSPRHDAFVLITTFLLTVLVDLTVAVGVGLVLAAILFIERVSGALSLNKIFADTKAETEGSKRLHASLRDYPEIVLYELAGPLFFGVASELENRIQHGPEQILILRMKHVSVIDATALHALEIIVDRAVAIGGRIYFSTLHSEVRAKFEHEGLIRKIGGEKHLTETTSVAIERAKEEIDARRAESARRNDERKFGL